MKIDLDTEQVLDYINDDLVEKLSDDIYTNLMLENNSTSREFIKQIVEKIEQKYLDNFVKDFVEEVNLKNIIQERVFERIDKIFEEKMEQSVENIIGCALEAFLGGKNEM